MPYLRGATDITIVDPYIRLPHQGRNLVDLLALLAATKDPADEIAVTLVTKEDRGEYEQQHLLMLKDIQDSAATVGIQFTVTWDETIHDRSIRTRPRLEAPPWTRPRHLPEGLRQPVRPRLPPPGVPPGLRVRHHLHQRRQRRLMTDVSINGVPHSPWRATSG